jgi:hypothetical protein
VGIGVGGRGLSVDQEAMRAILGIETSLSRDMQLDCVLEQDIRRHQSSGLVDHALSLEVMRENLYHQTPFVAREATASKLNLLTRKHG